MSGSIIGGRYECQDEIGAGGMGQVYRAQDLQTGLTVAIKRLRPELSAANPEIVSRFQREAEALRQLNHPNIVTVYDSGQDAQGHYIVMEYVSGGSLADLLMDIPRLPLKRLYTLALDLADALTRAHRLDIIHRDLKPANILIAEDATPRLTDFGVAHFGDQTGLTQAGGIVGTYAYLSPEAATGQPPSVLSDIWSFGVILFEMLTGERPFKGDYPAAVLTGILTQPAPDIAALRPETPDALQDLVYRMLTKNRAARIPSVRLVGAELEALSKGEASTLYGSTPITAVAAERDFAPTSTPTAQRLLRLPAQSTPFIGRQRELAELSDLLAGDCRLITLHGPGGMGKSRLSIEAARLVSPQFSDGVFWVALAPLTGPEQIAGAIGEALEFKFGGGDPLAQLQEYLRERHLLLVMDNFEHVAAGASDIAALLEAAPGLRVLASSRARLGVQAECLYDLGGMDLPTSESATVFEEFSAVQMFLAYASRSHAGFQISEGTKPAILRICRAVQGMPLGLELAAAWLRLLSPEEIAQELEADLDFLESDGLDRPERHRSMRAVFDYSWKLLDEAGRASFMALSVFRGGFTREAAQQVTGCKLPALVGLVDRSLLRRDAGGRFELHELLRQYAAEQLEGSGKAEDFRRRHADYYLARLIENSSAQVSSIPLKTRIGQIEQEWDNIRVAAEQAIKSDRSADMPEVLNALTSAVEILGRYLDGISLYSEAIDHLRRRPEMRRCLGLALVGLAGARSRLSQTQQALALADEARPILLECGLPTEITYATVTKSYYHMALGDLNEALRWGAEAVEAGKVAPESPQYETALSHLGYLHYLNGQHQEALRLMREANRLAHAGGMTYAVAYSSNNMAEVLMALGDYDGAAPRLAEAYSIFQELGNKRGMAFTRSNEARIALFSGDAEQAMPYFDEAAQLYREIGDRWGYASVLEKYVWRRMMMGDEEGALKTAQEALSLRREIGDSAGIAESQGTLGMIHLAMGDMEQAALILAEAAKHSRQLGYVGQAANIESSYAAALLNLGLYKEALAAAQSSFDTFEGLGEEANAAGARASLALAHMATGNYEMGEEHLHAANQPGMRETGLPREFLLSLGWALLHLHKADLALAREALIRGVRAQNAGRSYRFMLAWWLDPALSLLQAESQWELLGEALGFAGTLTTLMQRTREALPGMQAQVGAALGSAAAAALMARGQGLSAEELVARITADGTAP